MTTPTFFAHNILLDNGLYTMGSHSLEYITEQDPRFQSGKRILELVFSRMSKKEVRIADLGCQEGGYSVGFARAGFYTVGLEVRQINYDACMYVKQNVELPNLHFYKDNVMNTHKYGEFEAIWCSGLLYHLDTPRAFLEYIAPLARKILLLQTHFAPDNEWLEVNQLYNLSSLTENEGLIGRWMQEHGDDDDLSVREKRLGSSYENAKSFWLQRVYLLDILKKVGFDIVFESYDFLGDIAYAMLNKEGYYRKHSRGLFVGIKADK